MCNGAEPGQVQQGSGEGSRDWCRARSGSTGFQKRFRRRFQEAFRVPEKVPEKAWEALVQSQVRSNRVSEKVPEKVWEALVQSQVRFNEVPEKVPGSLGAKPSQAQQGSGEGSRKGSGEGRGGFGAKPSQAQQGSGEGSGEGSRKHWCKAKSGSTGFRRTFPRRSGRLWRSQVRFNRVPEKVAEKAGEGFGNL